MGAFNLTETIRRVQADQASLSPLEMRQRLLRMAMGLRVDTPAEYAVISGCKGTTSFVHLRYFGELLKHFKIDYTFLSEETCCGNSYLEHLDPKELGDEIAQYEEFAQTCVNGNLERAHRLGAKAVVTACAGCNTRYNQFNGNGDLPIVYYTQLLANYIDSPKLEKAVNFYEGCHMYHRTPGFRIDTKTSKELVQGIAGIEVSDIPNLCCRNLADKIFAKATTDTIVTPTPCCVAFLGQARKPDSPRVIPLTQLLCQSLGIA